MWQGSGNRRRIKKSIQSNAGGKKKSSSNDKQEEHETSKPLLKMSYTKYTSRQKKAILELVPHIASVEIEQKFGVDEATVDTELSIVFKKGKLMGKPQNLRS